jgi:Zn-finger nucleic acid-binding protein
MQMTCPKCHGEMRIYERSGVTVDQCTECRGIFLDRGELEKLFEAESSWNSRQAPSGQPQQGAPYTPPPPPPAPGYPQSGGQPGYPPPGYPPPGGQQPGYPAPVVQHYGQPYAQPGPGHHGHYRQHHGHYRNQGHGRKRRGFLGELFD